MTNDATPSYVAIGDDELDRQIARLRKERDTEAFVLASRDVNKFGVSMQCAAAAMQSLVAASKKLEGHAAELRAAMESTRPWYRRGRW